MNKECDSLTAFHWRVVRRPDTLRLTQSTLLLQAAAVRESGFR